MLKPEFIKLYPGAAIINFILHKVECSLTLTDQRIPHLDG
jgi:hypothetical protein